MNPQKVTEYKVLRQIFTLPIMDGWVAYLDTVLHDGVLTTCKEGIAFSETIEVLQKNDPIKIASIKSDSTLALCTKKIRETHRIQNVFSPHEGNDDFYLYADYIFDKPYSYLQTHGLDGVELLSVSNYSHDLFDLNNVRLPKMLFFDYMSGVDDGSYDLYEVKCILKQRDDIVWVYDGIRPIPYYNRDDFHAFDLCFKWIPSVEDFQLYDDSGQDTDFVLNNIFGLKKKPI